MRRRSFTDTVWGNATANQEMSQNADVIFAAGGLTGNGALLAVADKGGSVLGIGVDTDQYLSLPEAKSIMVSSAMKLIMPGVFNIIKAAQDGTFKGGNVTGDVGLAPYHDLDSKVPADVKTKMNQVDRGRRRRHAPRPASTSAERGPAQHGCLVATRRASAARRVGWQMRRALFARRSRSWRSSPRWCWAPSSSRLTGGNVAAGLQGLWEGSFGRPRVDLRDAGLGDAVHLRRPGGGAGLQRRPVQHRRRGPDRRRLAGDGLRRLRGHRACRSRSTCCWRCWRASLAGAAGRDPGLPQGAYRAPTR